MKGLEPNTPQLPKKDPPNLKLKEFKARVAVRVGLIGLFISYSLIVSHVIV